jgi:hypothetical protein
MLDFLKNVPDMTNTPEITMHEEAPKIPMTKRIRDYKAANPNATAKQVAEAVGTTAVYVYQALANPPKKAKPVKKEVTPSVSEKPVKNKELEAAKDEIETLNMVIDVLKKQNEKHLAVIQYLEGKIDDLGGLVC